MRTRLLAIILYSFLSLLLLTGIQGIFRLVREKELLGVVTVSEKCVPTTDSIMNGAFQQCATIYLNNHLGFRNTLIRLNNQVTFSLFRISSASIVLIGKDHFLFQTGYINSYLGNDYAGRTQIAGKVRRLLEFQKIMERYNVHFILAFCPSKARFMPEKLPDKVSSKGHFTNYDTYVDILNNEGKEIHFIDFNRYFQAMKDTCSFTLYPKAGIHWSNFSSRYYALDSLLRYMEHLSGEKYARLETDRIYWSDSLLTPDDDLSEMLNLMLPYPAGKVSYADFAIDTAGKTKPDVLTIGDSYYWQIYGFDKISSIFRQSDFWVWNEVRFPKSKYSGIKADDYTFLKQDLLGHNFIILMVTETNLPTLLNFDEQIYALFDPNNPVVRELQKKRADRIGFFKKLILNDPKWSALVRQKAVDRKISFEQMLENDAEYMVDEEINNLKNK
jgi:hypothetical protein